jgi:hypothetical protein
VIGVVAQKRLQLGLHGLPQQIPRAAAQQLGERVFGAGDWSASRLMRILAHGGVSFLAGWTLALPFQPDTPPSIKSRHTPLLTITQGSWMLTSIKVFRASPTTLAHG